MEATVESQIREWVVRYLAGEISLAELEEWFVPASWDVESEEAPATAALAYDIQLALAEHAQEHLSDLALRKRLQRLVETVDLGPHYRQTTGSAALTQRSPWSLSRLAVAGRRREGVSA